MRTFVSAVAAAALLGSAAAAQSPSPTPPAVRAMAAGYEALTLCSALKTAEAAGGSRSLESVRANELAGIYPELDPLIGTMPVNVEEAAVRVAWDASMPPRAALFDQTRGCRIMPAGWSGPASGASPRPTPLAAPLVAGEWNGDRARLDQAIERAFGEGYGQGARTTAIAILHNDRLVAERYAAGFSAQTPQRTWSVAKSIAATLVGAAVQRGEIDVELPAAIPQWGSPGDPRSAITLDQLLRMSSGLTSDTAGNRTDALYFGGVGLEEQAPGWPLIAQPGTTYRYANNDTLLAVLAIRQSFQSHPPEALFRELGMTHTWAETDWRGDYVLSSQVWTTARDLLRFGRLYLRDGVAEGRRILPEDWLEYVSAPAGPQPEGSQGYGAAFWLMNRSEGVPPDAISANGNRGQHVVIIPSRDLVIVRRGEDPAGRRFDHIGFTRDVLSALD